MPSAECTSCDLRWELNANRSKCPVCGAVLLYSIYSPTDDVEDLLTRLSPTELIQTITVAPYEKEGQLFLSSHALIRSGMQRRLQPDEILRVADGETSYHIEVLHYVDSMRAYHVRLFRVHAPTHYRKADWEKPRRKRRKQ